MIVKQVSVFVENTVGRLADLTKILTDNNIDLKASTIAETVDFGILRCIVEDPEKTVKILVENGFSASIFSYAALISAFSALTFKRAAFLYGAAFF